jgi:ceramide glucosyltransferase
LLAFWILISLAILLALASLRGEQKRADYVTACLAEASTSAGLPPATVIVPLKGEDEGLRENLASLASMDYPDYELIVVARAAGDIPEAVVPEKARVVLAGDADPATGEKVNNLLAAVDAARESSQIFAFADSDGRVQKGWLRALAVTLARDNVGAATGYRWHLPTPPDFWSLMRSVWNSVIGGGFGPGPNRFAWGGAMAIRRDVFRSARVASFWKGSISDDYALTAAVRNAGLQIAYAPGALVVSTDHVRAGEFFGWIRRQMVITRVYYPKLWWLGFISHLIYCAAMAASVIVAVQGSLIGEYALMAQWGLGMLKGANRAAIAKAALPEYKSWFNRHGWVHTWWIPLATWFWLYSFLASTGTNVIEWRGNRYDLTAKDVRKL